MSSPAQVPSGFDWADGVTPLPVQGGGVATIGTPTPDDAVLITDASGTNSVSFNESADSPTIERAEQATIKHEFDTSWYDAFTRIYGLGLGTILYDSFGNETKVLSATVQRMGGGGLANSGGSPTGGAAKLTIIAEGLSFDTPPDEFSIEAVDLGLNIIKNPRYFYALYPTDGTNPNYPNNDYATNVTLSDGSTCSLALVKQQIIRAIQTYQDSPFFPSANQINSLIQNQIVSSLQSGTIQITTNAGTTVNLVVSAQTDTDTVASLELAFSAAGEIVQKLWNQEDNPPLSGYKISWSRYYFKDTSAASPNFELYLNPGSYIEDPIYQASPALPDYFGSTVGDYTVDTIFDNIAFLNPQAYSADGTEGSDNPPPIYGSDGENGSLVSISWLRQADVQDYQRTWFKVTRSWIGSPIGHWDFQIFSNGERPAAAIDYLPLAS